jgi:pimeloyl-ACP methyl ester carboxylesterase
MRTVSLAGGVDLAYDDEGDGPPLVLLHGFEGNRHQFDGFAPLLTDRLRVLRYDQRDTPDSQNPDEPYTRLDLVDDYVGFLDALGLASAHVMGYSYGGLIAFSLALDRPQAVRSLVLAATTPDASLASPERQQRYRTATDGAAARDEVDFMGTMVSPEFAAVHPEVVAEVLAGVATRSTAQRERRLAAVLGAEGILDRLGDIAVPTLVVHGTADPNIPPESARWVADRIPGAQLELVDGVRHGLVFEQRERTATAVADFVLAQT